MLVRFTTRHASLTLLGESAVALLKLGGHSGTVPGAILAADLPAFLGRLKAGLVTHGGEPSPAHQAPQPGERDADEDATETSSPVTLRMRAVPLLEAIETAIARGSDLMWESGT